MNNTLSQEITNKGTDKQLINQIAKGAGTAFIGIVIGKFLYLGFHILTGRVLGPARYGLYALGISVVSIARCIATLGLNQGVIRFCSMYSGKGDIPRIKGIILLALVISFAFSALVSTTLFSFSNLIACGFFHKINLAVILQIFSFSIPFYVLMDITSSFARSFKRIDYQQGVQNIFYPAINLVLAGFVFLLGFRLLGVVYAFLISGVLSAGFGIYLLWRLFPHFTSRLKPLYETKNLLRFSLPLIFVGLSYFLLIHTDRIMLGFFRNAKNVGIYTAAAVIAMQVSLIHSALITIFAPIISNLHNQNQHQKLKELYKTVTRWDLVFTLIGFSVLSLFSRELLYLLYGAKFARGSGIIIILLFSYLISSAAGPTGVLLQMTGRQNIEFWNAGVLIGCNIILNLLLIPLYGAIGAAIATVLAFLLLNIIQLLQISKILKITPFASVYFRQAIPIFVLSVMINLFCLKYNFLSYKITGIIIFLGIFLFLLYQTKIEEDKIVLSALNKGLKQKLG